MSSAMLQDTQTDWIARGQQVVMNTYGRFPIVIELGEGCTLFDVNGKSYLDFVSGIAVNNLGYQHPVWMAELSEQLGKFAHCSNLYWNPPQIELAELLTRFSAFDRVFFCNSGAEAVEAALKLARKYGKHRKHVIAMENSFHGRTYGAMTLTGQPKYHKNFEPLVPEISYAAFNNFEAVSAQVTQETCAILIEPIQGEGGIQPANPDFLKKVRALCDEKDIVLIFDEVQCGIGRTGKLFGYENFDMTPDMIALAKGLGGGFPIGAMMAVEKVAVFEPGDHASTFGGNALACKAGKAVLDTLLMNEQALLKHTVEIGNYLKSKLAELQKTQPMITDIRGMGLMIGIELDRTVASTVQKCIEQGLLLVGAGPNVLRFVPPLIVTKTEIDAAIAILTNVLNEVSQTARGDI